MLKSASKKLDENLAHLAWSLWTELGVAGLERNHQNFSVAPEELILLTSVLSEFDPRLRDEALDWCIQYHRFISPFRLQILAKKYEEYISKPFSTFSATLNSIADIRTKWVVLTTTSPLKYRPSCKSHLRNFEAPSMILFRLRSLVGASACSDVLAFLLSEKREDFAISDLLGTGYSKRRLAAILEDLALAGILSKFQVRNQLRYTFARRNQLIKLLGNIPKNIINWDKVLAVLLPIRACLQAVEESPIGVRVIDMRNLLIQLSNQLLQLKLTPPPFQKNLEAYWNSVTEWILDFSSKLIK
ncbi:MAG: hypothetical protein ABSA17_01695 [Rhabdochlamydiaceae bacterium]|jgi:hypothetical protein